MEDVKSSKLKKLLYGFFVVIALFLIQTAAGKAGGAIADLFTYVNFDPDDVFAWLSVHHIIMLLIGLSVIAALKKPLKADFGFQLGDRKKGMRYFIIFTGVLTGISLLYHIFLRLSGQSITYNFMLNQRNIIGTLGFQLLLSGTAEEILYRALPVTVLIYVFGKSISVKGNITLEILLASLLFALAHVRWSLFPFAVDANISQLFYAFAVGTVQGMAYQESRSILYPIFMHSVSNVLMVGMGYLFALL